MNYIDVFNGDADGICSLIQLRRANPVESKLVTGVKRDIKLLEVIPSSEAGNALITVLDISYEKNADDVSRLLAQGASIQYFDHHKTGKIIKHGRLQTTINLQADICTALLVNNALNFKYQAWALTGAFGDNLISVAEQMAQESDFNDRQISQMQRLGHLVNYNAYGDSIEDLHYAPIDLYRVMANFDDPFSFIAQNHDIYKALDTGYHQDMDKANNVNILSQTAKSKVYELPNEKWSRRVSGVFGNHLANQYPNHAIAVLRKKTKDTYIVSIRAPLNNKQGADIIASEFPTGGGRKAAAGINALPVKMLDQFISQFEAFYQ